MFCIMHVPVHIPYFKNVFLKLLMEKIVSIKSVYVIPAIEFTCLYLDLSLTVSCDIFLYKHPSVALFVGKKRRIFCFCFRRWNNWSWELTCGTKKWACFSRWCPKLWWGESGKRLANGWFLLWIWVWTKNK